MPTERYDVVIAGGGPVGAALALALGRSGLDLSCCLVTPPGSGRYALRPVALGAPSERLLARFGVLDVGDPSAATPIRTIHVSQRGSFGRTVIHAAEHGLPALGYVVDLDRLASRMLAAVQPGMIVAGEMITRRRIDDHLRIELADPHGVMRTLDAQLVVLADGERDPDSSAVRRYEQTGIVTTVAAHPGHDNVAWERFTPEGPLALLPCGERYAVVWSVRPARAKTLMEADDADFCDALTGAFGSTRVRFSAPAPRVGYPLILRRTQAPLEGGVVTIGNAAQTLHPVAGQGLNLGLRDAETLATRIADAIRAGRPEDLGSLAFARGFAASRFVDRGATIAATDLLARIFATDRASIALARGLGLTILDVLPPLRGLLARRMMLGHRGLP